MIQYRVASEKDLVAIAQLHAQSWKENYRGSFTDTYLDGPVAEERLEVWQKRFAKPDPDMHIILAEKADQLCGFVCLFTNNDLRWGSLIDNLHVANTMKGQGIGKQLMEQAFQYIKANAKNPRTFLYVLIKNKTAISFYKKLGGALEGSEIFQNPGGGTSSVYRFTWH